MNSNFAEQESSTFTIDYSPVTYFEYTVAANGQRMQKSGFNCNFTAVKINTLSAGKVKFVPN